MAKQLLTFFLVLLYLSGSGQPQVTPAITSNFVWATTLSTEPLAVVADGPRGAYVLTKGNTLIQFDNKGRERWKQTFTGWPAMQRLAVAPNGRVVVSGTFSGQFTVSDSTYRPGNAAQQGTFIAQFDSTHARRWVTYVLTPKGQMSRPISLATDATGGVLVLGSQAGTGIPFLSTFDTDGRFVSASTYGTPTIPGPQAIAVAADSRGAARMAITERTRSAYYGLLVANGEDTLRWRTYIDQTLSSNTAGRSYDTSPVDLALDRSDNLFVLSNYTLTDRSLSLPIETGQVLLRYDDNGRSQWVRTGVSRSDSAVGTGLLVDQAGAFVVYGGYDGPYDQGTNEYGPADYISLAGYAPNGTPRWSTRLNAPTGTDRLLDAAMAENGSLLLLGKTTGTLALGTLSVTGTAATPAYYLTYLQPFVLRPTAAAVMLCAGSSVPLSGTYTGYFEQNPVLQLSDAQGNFTSPRQIGSVPIGVAGNLFNSSSFTLTASLASSLAAGTGYRLRAATPLPVYVGDPLSVTVGIAPAIPAVTQIGDELVASSSVVAGTTYQWYTNGRQPVADATSPRFRPGGGGAYYVVAIQGGCPSLPSEALNYIITANEPVIGTINVYPNPATGRFRVYWPNSPANGLLTLTDLTGRTVQQQSPTGNTTEVDVSQQASGLYLLLLQAEGQPTQVRKVQLH